jgi:hypothetical protein
MGFLYSLLCNFCYKETLSERYSSQMISHLIRQKSVKSIVNFIARERPTVSCRKHPLLTFSKSIEIWMTILAFPIYIKSPSNLLLHPWIFRLYLTRNILLMYFLYIFLCRFLIIHTLDITTSLCCSRLSCMFLAQF